MKLRHIIQKLYPTINQCETLDAKTLKPEKSQLIRQLHSLKAQYDKEYETLIEKLSSVTQDVLLRDLGNTLPNTRHVR